MTAEPPYEVSDEQRQQFWKSFLLAVQAEPRQATELRGASGFLHPAIAVGVDDIRRRIVVISRDHDPRSAAFAQHDIESANPSYRVVLARPVAVNVAQIGQALSEFLSAKVLGAPEWGKLKLLSQDPRGERFAEGLNTGIRGFQMATVDQLTAWQDGVQQLSHIVIDWRKGIAGESVPASTVDLTGLLALDPTQADRTVGNCPVPLYDFDVTDAEILHRGNNIEAVRDVLRRKQLLQYFYPSPDQLVLGFAVRGARARELSEAIAQAPLAGHPLGALELVPDVTKIEELIDTLVDRKLLVEGECGFELTDDGRKVRASIRFKPREGFLKKLSRILSLKIDVGLKDFFQ